MNVDDIDILCDKKTAEACNSLFKKFVLEEVTYKASLKFKSYFGKFKINNILVEIMGEWQIKDTNGNWSGLFNASAREKTEITLEGQKIFVTTPETELLFFAKMGRWNAYQKIKKQTERHKDKDKRPSLF